MIDHRSYTHNLSSCEIKEVRLRVVQFGDHTRCKQIKFPLRGRPILLSLV